LYALAVVQLSGSLTGPIYTGEIKYPIMILEAVASHDRWIWYIFFSRGFQQRHQYAESIFIVRSCHKRHQLVSQVLFKWMRI
jgi:hypothetical protein